ncbi:MAG TPA: DUF434 domain-containing protein [Deltaproteobacteria bacterium]|nr:DUF434 domain-containing protein [Deltaproteobacteria bacterium]
MAGADPRDARDFAPRHHQALVTATHDLSWLLSRGYAEKAALKLVGDRLQLTGRQRMAVLRAAAPFEAAEARRQKQLTELRGRTIAVDGFNQLVTTERGLAGGTAFRGIDGAVRDVASVHGTWRRSDGTRRALSLLLDQLEGAAQITWVLDSPVSNSGLLAALIREQSGARGAPCVVQLEVRADAALLELGGVLASSDSALLDRCEAWVALSSAALAAAGIEVLDLARDPS